MKNLAFHPKGGIVILILLGFILIPSLVFARVTPEDIVQEKRVAYETKVKNYSAINQQKLEKLAKDIALVNKKRTDELENIMIAQGTILDEYENRSVEKNSEAIKNARYWITYAHEAVAYQAAKIYIYNLTSEGNIKNDAVSLINQMAGELNSSKIKVINSQKTLEKTIND